MSSQDGATRPIVRAACVLIEDGRLLLVKQEVTATRHWALPGGKLEIGETLAQCVKRELIEETGLDCQISELLYVTDRILGDSHVVHIAFMVEHIGSVPLPAEWKHVDPHPSSSSSAGREVRMVRLDQLGECGFSPVFCKLINDGFPGRGGYKGDFGNFYGD